MNNIYETTLLDRPTPIQTRIEAEEYALVPLGTFAGTLYKVLYRSNGSFLPSDTSDQLIFDGLR